MHYVCTGAIGVAIKILRGFWIWGFPVIWGAFFAILDFYDRNGFSWGWAEPGSFLNAPMTGAIIGDN